ncbi:hypothetical protein ES703_110932 [subsurface metagenome]
MKLIPGRLQSAFELLLGWLYDFCCSAAGEKNGRRFFPVVTTIFLFVAFNNLPGTSEKTTNINELGHITTTKCSQPEVLHKAKGHNCQSQGHVNIGVSWGTLSQLGSPTSPSILLPRGPLAKPTTIRTRRRTISPITIGNEQPRQPRLGTNRPPCSACS